MKEINLRPGGLELTNIAAATASVTADSHVLDIGCGTAASLYALWQEYDCHVAGIDNSAKAIESSKHRFTAAKDFHAKKDTVRLMVSDASMLSFPDDSFDLVMMECTITLFDDPYAVLAEATRVLKPGGILFLSALTRRVSPSNDEASALVLNGLLQTDVLTAYLSENGYQNISCTERNDVLFQFVTDAIFTYGSLANYIKEASACINGCVLNCTISPKEAGYAYVLAQKCLPD